MFNQDSPAHAHAQVEEPLCYRCNSGAVSSQDVFATHCADCLAGMTAEVEVDFGEIGEAQTLLAGHRAFADWLHGRDAGAA